MNSHKHKIKYFIQYKAAINSINLKETKLSRNNLISMLIIYAHMWALS